MTGKTIDYVINWFGNDHALDGTESVIFLAHHNMYLANYGIPAHKGEYITLEPSDEIDIKWSVGGHPALLVVQSERFEEKLHAVFWDGEKVFDPSPLVKTWREISSYKIMEFWPLLIDEEIEKQFPLTGTTLAPFSKEEIGNGREGN